MFEKIGKIFTAIIAFFGAIAAFFLMAKTGKNNSLDNSYNEDKVQYEKDKKESSEEHEESISAERVKHETALRDLSDEKDRELQNLEEDFKERSANSYEENKKNPEKLVKELSEKYDLEDV